MKRTTMNLDEAELRQLREELKLNSDAEVVREAIRMALQSLAYTRMRTYAGSEKGLPLVDVPRRREPVVRTRQGRAKKSA